MAFNAELAKRVAADKERRLRCGPQDRRLGVAAQPIAAFVPRQRLQEKKSRDA